MVFLSAVNLVRSRGPDEFWRKRRIFRLAAHFLGRRRNVYSVAVRNVHRALVYATKGRLLRREDRLQLWTARIQAAADEASISSKKLRNGLDRANVMLDRHSLSDLATWEGRSFSALAALARFKMGLSTDRLGQLFFKNKL